MKTHKTGEGDPSGGAAMNYAMYCRLDVHVNASDRTVIRAARKRVLKSKRSREYRELRHRHYRAMLHEHEKARRLYDYFRFGG